MISRSAPSHSRLPVKGPRPYGEAARTAAVRGGRALPSHSALLELQRTAGNAAVSNLIARQRLAPPAPSQAIPVQRVLKAGESLAGDQSYQNLVKLNLQPLAEDGQQLDALQYAARDKNFKKLVGSVGLTYTATFPEDEFAASLRKLPPKLQRGRGAIVALLVEKRHFFENYESNPPKLVKKNLDETLPGYYKVLETILEVHRQYEKYYQQEQDRYRRRERAPGGAITVAGSEKDALVPKLLIKKATSDFQGLLTNLTRKQSNVAITLADMQQVFAVYNQHGWTYDPGADVPPEVLISGHSRAGHCGAFSRALHELVKIVAKARGVDNPLVAVSKAERFVTKRYDHGFIDLQNKGNVAKIVGRGRDEARLPVDYDTHHRAIFTGHSWLEGLGTIWDPLARDTGDYTDPAFGVIVQGESPGWIVAEADTPPPKGFGRGYVLIEK